MDSGHENICTVIALGIQGQCSILAYVPHGEFPKGQDVVGFGNVKRYTLCEGEIWS